MEEKVSGIILGGVNFGENDKILNVFTLEKGLISAKIKGVKKAGAKLKFASEPFCFAEFVLSVTNAGNTIIGASLFDSFYPVREDIVKYFCGGTVLEFVKKFFRENIVSPETFLSVISVLKNIAYADGNPKAFLLEFLKSELSEEGYALSDSQCKKCKNQNPNRVFFDYADGSFLCENCFDGLGREISVVTFGALRKLKENIPLTEEECVKALRLIDFYVENKTDVTLKSLKELIKISPV